MAQQKGHLCATMHTLKKHRALLSYYRTSMFDPSSKRPSSVRPLFCATPLLCDPSSVRPLFCATPLLCEPSSVRTLFCATPLLCDPSSKRPLLKKFHISSSQATATIFNSGDFNFFYCYKYFNFTTDAN